MGIPEIDLKRVPMLQSIVDGFAHATLGQEASGKRPALQHSADTSADGPALTAAIRISQRATGIGVCVNAFNVVEVADLEQDPTGIFGCMIERFVKRSARVRPTAGQKDRFTFSSPMPGKVIVSAVAIKLDRTVKIDRNEFLQTLRFPAGMPFKEYVLTRAVSHPKMGSIPPLGNLTFIMQKSRPI